MKFTLSWLKTHLDTPASVTEISESLTSLGLEVEKITDPSKTLAPFVVAEILAAERHPQADKLQVCKVSDGKEILQIVCGAANARAGIKVVLAPVGSLIPANDLQIKASKIRGVESSGMLCSAEELTLGSDSEGIIELGNDAKPGARYIDYAKLDDPLFEIAITPNRGDCLGVRGIARDLAAKGLGKLKPIHIPEIKSSFVSPVKVSSEDAKLCPLFIGRYFKNVKNQESPSWLKARLESIGLKPISALVDITNFITFDLGRPLHVYDAKKLKGNIAVKTLKSETKFTALDDKTYSLEPGILAVTDDSGPVALAGVIGGKDSGCSMDTSEVFLEVAVFDPVAVAMNGRKTMIDSDSRHRFERGLDYDFAVEASAIASNMILQLCGGSTSELVIEGKEKSAEKSVKFDLAKVKNLGGVEIPADKINNILESLGFIKKSENFIAPSWRNDISESADMVEEVLRVHGYDNIPLAPLSPVNTNKPALSAQQKNVIAIKRILATRGLSEVVTFSFMHCKDAANFGATDDAMKLVNPISSDLDYLRPSIIGNLLTAAAKNMSRGFSNLAIMEVGPEFSSKLPNCQRIAASGIRTGSNAFKNIYKDFRPVDFYDVKADVIACLPGNVNPETLSISANAPGYYHPGKSAIFALGKNVIANFGEIHPVILKKMEIEHPVAAFEIYLENLPVSKQKSAAKTKFAASNFPYVDRDFAFVLDDKILAGDITKTVRNIDKDLIESVRIFDVYKGKGIEDGKKSLALTIRLLPKDRTLQAAEIEALSQKVIEAVKTKLGGEIRG